MTLLERGEIASEASGVNAGGIGALGWGNLPNLESYLTMGSLQIFKRLQLEQGYDIEFRASGALQAIQTAEQYQYTRDNILSLKARGYTAELLTAQEARAIEPELSPDLWGAMYMPLRAQADPVKTTRALAHAAAQRGAQVLTGREVAEITREANGEYSVACDGERHTADSLVIAAGAWCAPLGRMLGLNIPIIPVRGQMWATEPVPPRVFHSISAAESPMNWSASPGNDAETPPELTHIGERRVTRHLYGRQTRDGEIIFGGDRRMAGYDKTVDPAGTEGQFRSRSRAPSHAAGAFHQSRLVRPDALLPGRPAGNREDSPVRQPVHCQRPGIVRLRSRANGRQAARGLRPHRPPAPCAVGMRPGPARHCS